LAQDLALEVNQLLVVAQVQEQVLVLEQQLAQALVQELG
jgi:hypothetical protein